MGDEPMLIAIAVVELNGRFLVGLRPDGVPLAGLSEFPGGKVEPDETPEAAAARECFEESGIAVDVRGRFPESVHRYPHGQVRLLFFDCHPRQATVQPAAPFRWVAREDLTTLQFPAGNDALLAMLQATGDGAA